LLITGWWHLVVNLSESIAVTQNFVPPSYLQNVLRFLSNKKDQVSGFSEDIDPYKLFRGRLEAEYPELLKAADAAMSRRTSTKRKWVEESEPSNFTFDFFK